MDEGVLLGGVALLGPEKGYPSLVHRVQALLVHLAADSGTVSFTRQSAYLVRKEVWRLVNCFLFSRKAVQRLVDCFHFVRKAVSRQVDCFHFVRKTV